MKTNLLFIIAILFACNIFGQNYRDVSYDEAISYVERLRAHDGVDIYSVEFKLEPSNNFWYVFVDEQPWKGWEHDCTLYAVSKRKLLNSLPTYTTVGLKLPPQDAVLKAYSINSQTSPNPNLKIIVPQDTLSNYINEEAQNTYAIILSGGANPISNYERYWNDCSFIYQTLVNKYQVPKPHVKVIMADGTNTEADMRKADGSGYISSPLDLDFDGQPDIQYAATLENVTSVLDGFANTLTDNDHLFIYVIDHGGRETSLSHPSSYICLWGTQRLYDTTLATKLNNINAGSINVVLGQCNSGGFVNHLSGNGRVIATACGANEYSWACSNIPYDEFVYHWTCAVSGQDKDGNPIDADLDNNDKVTMQEAFAYAQANDTQSETPMYDSSPESIGEDLAFNYIPEGVDLYIRDNVADTGKEPNTSFGYKWNSPDIYIRNQNDGLINPRHQQPIADSQYKVLYVYTNITNRGSRDYNGSGKYLYLYWAEPMTLINPKVFRGEMTLYTGGTGDRFAHDLINFTIPAGETRTFTKAVVVPDRLYQAAQSNPLKKINFSVLAAVQNSEIDPLHDSIDSTEYYINQIVKNKKIAIKNISYLNISPLRPDTASVYVHSGFDYERSYRLEIRQDSITPALHFSDLILGIGNSHYGTSANNGTTAKFFPRYPNELLEFPISQDSCSINNIPIYINQNNSIKLYCNYKNVSPIEQVDTCQFDLILRDDETGEIVGGQKCVVIIDHDEIRSSSNEDIRFIRSVALNENSSEMTVLLNEAIDKDAIIKVSYGNDISLHSEEQTIQANTNSLTLNVAQSYQGMIIVSLLQNGQIIDTKKLIKQ